MKQRDLAKRWSVSSSYIGLIETGRRFPDRKSFKRLCSALKLSAAEEAELRGQSLAAGSAPDKVLTWVKEMLSASLDDLGGKSVTFYIRPPFWQDELRLVAMPGVKRVEPMYGFASPEGTKRVLLSGEDRSFCADAQRATERRDRLAKLPGVIPAEKRELFSDFVGREGVGSSARLLLRERGDGGTVKAVLFVNFDKPNEVGGRAPHQKEKQQKILTLGEVLSTHIREIENACCLDDAPIFQHAINILRPLEDLAGRIGEGQDTLEQYLSLLLDAAMAAVGLSPFEGFGTIHLYRSDDEVLELVAHRGLIGDLRRAQRQSVLQGEGIISWVVIKQRAILIKDLQNSPFQNIHVPVKHGIRSEVSVPMYAGKNLIGVLNLEAMEPEKFKEQHVRALWYAASNAALAVRLYHQVEENRKLAELNQSLLAFFCKPAEKDLSHIAVASLKATQVEMWRYDPARPDSFYSPVASRYPEECPRKKGWSEYICRTHTIVWISSICSPTSFDVYFWNAQSRVWETSAANPGAPESLNQRLVNPKIDSWLGLPILVDNVCVGVAWLAFDSPADSRPPEAKIRLAVSLAEGVGRGLHALPIPNAVHQQEELRAASALGLA